MRYDKTFAPRDNNDCLEPDQIGKPDGTWYSSLNGKELFAAVLFISSVFILD
jgi:hypothetical protein